LQNIIRSMMFPDPAQRPSAASLLSRRQLMSESERQLQIQKNTVTHLNAVLNNRGGVGEGAAMGVDRQVTRLKRAQTWQG
ncbi:hypothetical protein TeGR_g9562, partial [Tetraparma gracilis]